MRSGKNRTLHIDGEVAIETPEHPPTPYPDINEVLSDLLRRVDGILGDHLVGMYLFGSLAAGDFQYERSDIDFVVLTNDLLPAHFVSQLEAMHTDLASSGSKWAVKLEGAYLPRAVLRRHNAQHPPVPLLNEAKFSMEVLSGDWIIQRHQLRTHDARVAGPSLRDLIDEIRSEDLQWAVLDSFDQWWSPMLVDPSRLHDTGYQPYAVLSMCRSLYTLETGRPISKTDAARWALASLPSEWSSLIAHAMEWRTGDVVDSIDRTMRFIQYVIEKSVEHPVRRGPVD